MADYDIQLNENHISDAVCFNQGSYLDASISHSSKITIHNIWLEFDHNNLDKSFLDDLHNFECCITLYQKDGRSPHKFRTLKLHENLYFLQKNNMQIQYLDDKVRMPIVLPQLFNTSKIIIDNNKKLSIIIYNVKKQNMKVLYKYSMRYKDYVPIQSYIKLSTMMFSYKHCCNGIQFDNYLTDNLLIISFYRTTPIILQKITINDKIIDAFSGDITYYTFPNIYMFGISLKNIENDCYIKIKKIECDSVYKVAHITIGYARSV